MSTISLMPVNKRIKVAKDFKINMYDSLGNSRQILKEAGMLVGDELILDSGSNLRIEGFKAYSSVKGWPAVKITIYPEGSKSCQCYVDFSQFDGLSWETVEEKEKKEPREVQRINISFEKNERYLKDINSFPCWHRAFKNGFRIGDKDIILNPIELSKDEIEKRIFTGGNDLTVGEAIVKKGKNSYSYDIRIERTFNFKITIEPGYMYGNLEEVRNIIQMRKSYSHSDFFDVSEISTEDITDSKNIRKPVLEFLKKEHLID